MANNQYTNKVVFGNETLIDLTADTVVSAADLVVGKVGHLASGATATGTFSADGDITAADVLATKIAYANGSRIVGTMPNVGTQNITIDNKDDAISISAGYHAGDGKARIDATEKAKIVAGNIKNGVSILGVVGTYTGSENIKATTLSATPYTTSQTILPSSLGDYDYFTQVAIAAISRTEVDNTAGGKTVTIGDVQSA